MDLKAKLVQLRKEQGLTQLELAEKLNVSRQAVSRWELGTAAPSIENLMALRALFGVSLDDLLCAEATEPDRDAPVRAPAQEERPRRAGRWVWICALALAVIAIGILAAALAGRSSPRPENIWGTEVIIPMSGMEGDEIATNRRANFYINWQPGFWREANG